jgi:hypothetical protein
LWWAGMQRSWRCGCSWRAGLRLGGDDGVVSLECESCRALAAGRQMDVAAAAAMSDSDFDSSANRRIHHISDEML